MLLSQLDMMLASQALDMFASQTRDLYHIETDRKGGYIEFAARQIYQTNSSCEYKHIAFQEKRTESVKKHFLSFSYRYASLCIVKDHINS